MTDARCGISSSPPDNPSKVTELTSSTSPKTSPSSSALLDDSASTVVPSINLEVLPSENKIGPKETLLIAGLAASVACVG